MLLESNQGWKHSDFKKIGIYLKGNFYYKNKLYSDIAAIEKLYSILVNKKLEFVSNKEIHSFVQEIRGNFSFVIEAKDSILIAVDKIRSYPIYYSNGDKYVSNSLKNLKGAIDNLSLLEMEMSGFVLSDKTIYKEINQLLPGEFAIRRSESSTFSRIRYYKYGYTDKTFGRSNENMLMSQLHELHIEIFSELIKFLDGRPVWVPLSGGLDSRIVLALLLECGYENISTFSYGIKNFWEIRNAKKIAQKANVQWHSCVYDPRKTKSEFNSFNARDYYRAASESAVPAMNDFYAINQLRKKGLIPDDAVFINGQTGDFLTGGHIPEINSNECNVRNLVNKIITKHHSLWSQLKTKTNINLLSNEILSILNLDADDVISKDEFAKLYEYYEWQERQCKFVVNGQRIYEWFGYDWKLPLWDDRLMSFWETVPIELKLNRKFFRKYLELYNPGFLFDLELDLPDYRHIPWYWKFLTSLSRKLFPKYPFQENFVNYFSTYAAYHPHKNYWSFLKQSKGSRNAVSFHAKLIVDRVRDVG